MSFATYDALIVEALATLNAGAFDDARVLFDRAEESAEDDADREMTVIYRASIPVLQMDPAADLTMFREAILRRRSPRHVLTSCYYLFIGLLDRQANDDAARYLRIMQEMPAEEVEPLWRVRAYDAAAALESRRGNHDAAIELSQAAIEASLSVADSKEAMLVRAMAVHNHAYNFLAAGRYDDAYRAAMSALPMTEATGYPPAVRECLMTLAFASLGRGELADAEHFAREAEPLSRGHRLERYIPYVLGEVARRRGDVEDAERHFEKLRPFYPDVPDLTQMLLSMNLAPFLLPE